MWRKECDFPRGSLRSVDGYQLYIIMNYDIVIVHACSKVNAKIKIFVVVVIQWLVVVVSTTRLPAGAGNADDVRYNMVHSFYLETVVGGP